LKHPYKPRLEQHIKDWWNKRSKKMEQVTERGGELSDWQIPLSCSNSIYVESRVSTQREKDMRRNTVERANTNIGSLRGRLF